MTEPLHEKGLRIAIIGRTEILYDTAERLAAQGYQIALLITAKEAPEYKKTAEDFRALSENLGAKFLYTAKILSCIDEVRALPPIDIGVSLNYSGVIPQAVIDCFRLGILNAHGGDLPRYRGNACQAWAILNGEDRMGLCVHRMIGGELDSGDIVARDYHPIGIDTKVTALWDWLGQRTPSLFAEALERLEKDDAYVLERQSKDAVDALRCYPRRPEDGRIDWRRSAIDILRLINASNKPYAGAFCTFEEGKMIIWDAEIAPPENFLAVPGQVTLIADNFIEVATSDGKLRLKSAEYAGVVGAPRQFIHSIRQRLA